MEPGTISIPAPAFTLYESVTLHWNGVVRNTRIVARWYDVDEETWWYKVANDDQFYRDQPGA